jgi:hypothetical protein
MKQAPILPTSIGAGRLQSHWTESPEGTLLLVWSR